MTAQWWRFIRIGALATATLVLAQCRGSEILAPEPSQLDLDSTAPSCPGITDISITSGPTLTVTFDEARDTVSSPSKINYYIYMRRSTESYDLVSPAKIVVGSTTALISNGVAVGNTYVLFVSCRDEAGNAFPTGPTNERSITINDTLAPAAITDLAAGSPTMTSILLTWSPSDDGAGGTTAANMRYKVYGSLTTPVSTLSVPLATITGSTSYLHSGLDPNTRWYYRVVALDSDSNASTDSNQATNITLDDTTSPSFASDSGLTMTAQTTTSISLSWNVATDNVTSSSAMRYSIYRCTGSSTCDPFASSPVTTTAAGVTSYDDTGLAPSMTYNYGVRARDSRNNLSTNTDFIPAGTVYTASGRFYGYPTLDEVSIRFGAGVAIANVVGPSTGFRDLIVGAPNAYEPNGRYLRTGCIFIFPGVAYGQFSQTASKVICAPNPSADGGNNNRNFGYAIAAADVDLDSDQDLIVSYPERGVVYIFRTTNTSGTLDVPSTTNLVINATAPHTAGQWGMGLCTGNIDNVGADDIVIVNSQANCSDCVNTGTGVAVVYSNTSTPGTYVTPTSIISTLSPAKPITDAGGYTISNNEQLVRRCTIGNFDPTRPTQLQIVLSSGFTGSGGTNTDGLLSFYRVQTTGTSPTITFQNSIPLGSFAPAGSNWGEGLSSIQLDSNAHELAVGAPADSSAGTNAGAVYIYQTSLDTNIATPNHFVLTETPNTYFGGGDFNGNGVGQSIAAGAIFNHTDGKQDLVYGAWLDDRTNTLGAVLEAGDVYLHQNSSGIISSTVASSEFDFSNLNVRGNQEFGTALCKGDVNNDGLQDVMIGAPRQDYNPTSLTANTDVGALYVYYGVPVGEIDFGSPSEVLFGPGDLQSGLYGSSCVVMDTNADGANDLLVGSYNRTVGAAGRGIVYIYYGSTANPLPVASSAAIYNPQNVTNTYFGFSMTKGDWDGNGYDDLAISAVGVNNTTPTVTGVGRVYIYFAGVDGVIRTTGPTTVFPPNGNTGAAAVSGQHSGNPYLANGRSLIANTYFGYAMASFGTRAAVGGVIGQDLIICSPNINIIADETSPGSLAATARGLCYVYEGAINDTGTASQGYISAAPSNEIRNQDSAGFNTANVNFGTAATVGDWNRDGVDDLVICAQRARSSSVADLGGCYAYFGSVNGGVGDGGFNQYSAHKANRSSTRLSPMSDSFYYNPNQENSVSNFGRAALLVDINNNGLHDLLIGEPGADSETALDGVSAPSTVGRDAGRILIVR